MIDWGLIYGVTEDKIFERFQRQTRQARLNDVYINSTVLMNTPEKG